eukprot:9497141-Karenia_brevis.AAC.1
MFASEDKSNKQIRLEIATRKLQLTLAKAKPDVEFFRNKNRGKILHNYQELAQVTVDIEDEEPQVLWKLSKVRAMGIDRDAIKQDWLSSMVKRATNDDE